MKRSRLFLIASLILTAYTAFSQDLAVSPAFNDRYGIFGGIGLNRHISDFKKLPDVPNCCTNFLSASGSGINLGVLYETPVYNSILLGVRAGFFSFNADFSPKDTTTIIVNGQPKTADLIYTLNSEISLVGIEPMAMWNVYDYLFLSLGLNIGTPITKKYSQVERIQGRDGASPTFTDTQTSSRNSFSGDIPQASSLFFTGKAGLSYELPLNKSRSMIIAPEVFYNYGFTPVVQNYNWHLTSLQMSLSLKYSPSSAPKVIEEYKKLENIDTVTIVNEQIADNTFRPGIPSTKTEKNEIDNKIITTDFVSRTDTLFIAKKWSLSGSVAALGVDSTGSEIPNPVFVVEEFAATKLHPLLNYVFFDENSSDIPSRYIKIKPEEAAGFQEDKLYSLETLPVYYHMLNIIGKRLKDNPEANLTIAGFNSGVAEEKSNTGLSMKRAEAVKAYLVDAWKINPARLKTEAKDIPDKPSTPLDEPDKAQENRRVEFYSNVESILDPVLTTDTLRAITPPVARFKPTIKSDAGIDLAYINVSQSDKNYKEIALSDGKPYYDWYLNEDQNNIPRLNKPLDYIMNLKDKKANVFNTDKQSLPIDLVTIQKKKTNRIEDKEIEKYSLILFDFDKSDISGRNTRIVKFIKDRIKENSSIDIEGYTDRTGDNEYNRLLSEKRANSTLKALGVKTDNVHGIGEEVILYDNDLPEGRFYSRTVEINIETPIEYK